MNKQKLILASASPRRSAMMREMGISFDTAPSSFIEPPHTSGMPPRSYVTANARGKVLRAAEGLTGALVIGADTVVVHRGRVLGKPSSLDEAMRFLRMLNGETHEVFSGICLKDTDHGRMLTGAEKTRVTFRRLSAQEIEHYLELINPLDKAGGYAIQAHGSIIVERISGCYYNVVGFPLARLETMLQQWGRSLFDYMNPPAQSTF